jgi:hypothetical protein
MYRGLKHFATFLKAPIQSSGQVTNETISKTPCPHRIPGVGLIEEVAYLLRSALQGLEVVAHLLVEIVRIFDG